MKCMMCQSHWQSINYVILSGPLEYICIKVVKIFNGNLTNDVKKIHE